MTAPITGSTASAAFDDALARLRQQKLDYHTRRPPFDYDARPVVSSDASSADEWATAPNTPPCIVTIFNAAW